MTTTKERQVLLAKASLNVDEACQLAGVSKRTLYFWMQWGWLPYTEPRRWHRRFIPADVLRVRNRNEDV